MREVPARIAIYDLDRTVTFRPTYSHFLLQAAWALSPARLLLAPAAAAAMVAYKLGLLGRDRLKAVMWALLLGPVEGDRLGRPVGAFARGTLARNIRPGALAQIARDRAAGARLILATAAHELYAAPIADALGFDAVVATRAAVDSGGRIGPGLDGGNVFGDGKLAALARLIACDDASRPDRVVTFYSDSASDAPVFRWADVPRAVNPSRRLARLAAREGWEILDWGRP